MTKKTENSILLKKTHGWKLFHSQNKMTKQVSKQMPGNKKAMKHEGN